MVEVMRGVGVALGAYVVGSLPFALWVGRWRSGLDVRSIGSGHAGATNVMRAGGWAAGVLVLALDLGKGYVVMWVVQTLDLPTWSWIMAAALVVVGHSWPVLAGFKGGMGMAVAGGAALALWPLGFLLGVGLVAFSQLTIRHSARANFAAGIFLAPVWWALGASLELGMMASAAGLVVSLRALSDWNRVYTELWLDRGRDGPGSGS
jgi:glycerol-3-phosphate acyltransferase PlsY